MPLDEGLIEDSEEEYEDFSDNDSSHGLNHSEYLILAREHMPDELSQRNSRYLSENGIYESSTPNSNELLRREINDAQEDLQRALPRLQNLAATRPAVGGISKNITGGANKMSLTYPESPELPPSRSNTSVPSVCLACPSSCDEPDSNSCSGIVNATDASKLPMLPPPNPCQTGFLSSPRTIRKENNIYEHMGGAVSQEIACPASPPDSQQSPNRSHSRPKQSEAADDAILFPPFPVSSSLAETDIISSSMPLDMHEDHDAVATATQELPPKTIPEAERKRKHLVQEAPAHEIIVKKLRVETENPTPCVELQKRARLNTPQSPSSDSPPKKFEANETDVNVKHDTDGKIGRNRAKTEHIQQVMATNVKRGGVLFKQPAFRVGLSKRDRVDSLHAYLRR
ncbi:hypothetical protein V1509DRAFT_622951 [Lipomyces kononenkoae]